MFVYLEEEEKPFATKKNKKNEYKLLAKVQIHSSARKNSPVKKNVSKKLQRD